MKVLSTLTLTLLASSTLVAAPPALAQSNTQAITELEAQIDALTKRVNDLERGRPAVLPSPDPTTTAAPPPNTSSNLAAASGTASPTGAKASDVVDRDVPSAPLDRALQKPGSAFQLSASNDGGEVAIRLGTTITDGNLDASGTGNAFADTLSLTASAPLNDNGDRTDLGTLDGFADSSVLKVRWTRFTVPIAIPRASANARIRQRNADIIRTARANCLGRAGADADKIKVCNEDNDNDEYIATYDAAEVDEYTALHSPGPSFAFGLEGSIGYHQLKYFDATSLEEKSVQKVPLGAKGFVTWFPNISLTAITGSLEYQHDFEDQDSAIMCPVSTTAPVRCVSGPIGAPGRTNSLLAAFELRKQLELKNFWIPSIGIAPQITYDFLGKKGGVDVPIYVVPDAGGNLLGGVRFGYRTDTKDLAVGVFVGTAFSIRK